VDGPEPWWACRGPLPATNPITATPRKRAFYVLSGPPGCSSFPRDRAADAPWFWSGLEAAAGRTNGVGAAHVAATGRKTPPRQTNRGRRGYRSGPTQEAMSSTCPRCHQVFSAFLPPSFRVVCGSARRRRLGRRESGFALLASSLPFVGRPRWTGRETRGAVAAGKKPSHLKPGRPAGPWPPGGWPSCYAASEGGHRA